MKSETASSSESTSPFGSGDDCRRLMKKLDREQTSPAMFLAIWIAMVLISTLYLLRFEAIVSHYGDESSVSMLVMALFMIGWLMFAGDLWEHGNTIHRLPVSSVHKDVGLDVPITFRRPSLAEV